MTHRRYRQIEGFGLVEVDARTGRMLGDNEPPAPKTHHVHVVKEVVAPDGTRIASRAKMQDYEKRTGTTNDLDHLREQTQRENSRANNPNKARDSGRIAAILDSVERAQSSGFSRRVEYERDRQ